MLGCCLLQAKRAGNAAYRQFQALMRDLLEEIQARGPPSPDNPTLAAYLLRIRDPKGKPLSQDKLAAEIGILFIGAFETTGHTIAWTLYALFTNQNLIRKSILWVLT